MMVWVISGLAFGLPGGIFIMVAIINTKRAEASLAWPGVQGSIASSRVVKSSFTDNDGLQSDSYRATVEYEYSVAGQIYRGKRIAFGLAGSSSEDKERAVVERYKVGTPVKVFYNPAEPAKAVLEREVASSNKTWWALGVAFILIAIAMPLFVISG